MGWGTGFFELFNQICWFVLASIMYCTYSKLVNFLWVEVYRSYGVLVHLPVAFSRIFVWGL